MKSITVLAPGAATSIQDLGRGGWRRFGMPLSGAFDALSMRLANWLVGNEPGAAGLEAALCGPELQFEGDCAIALAGADMGAVLDGSPVAMYETIVCPSGSKLGFRGLRAGFRSYIGFHGGVGVTPVMGSRSTYARAAIGGLGGRFLARGDVIKLVPDMGNAPAQRRLSTRILEQLALPGFSQPGLTLTAASTEQPTASPLSASPLVPPAVTRLRIVPGPEAQRLSREAVPVLLTAEYRVDPRSDRMGLRLAGPALAMTSNTDIVSAGLLPGTLQLPGDGLPIILGVDAQTSGGYSRIANVISVDLHLLGQLCPGAVLRFEEVKLEAAHELLLSQTRLIESLYDSGCPAG